MYNSSPCISNYLCYFALNERNMIRCRFCEMSYQLQGIPIIKKHIFCKRILWDYLPLLGCLSISVWTSVCMHVCMFVCGCAILFEGSVAHTKCIYKFILQKPKKDEIAWISVPKFICKTSQWIQSWYIDKDLNLVKHVKPMQPRIIICIGHQERQPFKQIFVSL